jgi:hypothetical protein
MTQPPPLAATRRPLDGFVPAVFVGTILALIAAPIAAAADIFHSYLPFAALRLWMAGFGVYGILLANAAGGFRKIWAVPYAGMGLVFLIVKGPEVEQWAVIDFCSAMTIAFSALFLRTEPIPKARTR